MSRDDSAQRPAARPAAARMLIGLVLLASAWWTAAARADDGQWAEIGPPLRDNMAVVYDAARDRLIMFGGQSPEGVHGDVWALPLRSRVGWTPLAVPGVGPAPRIDASALYDPSGDRVFIAGGATAPGGACFGDLWTLDLSPSPHWVQWSPGAGPVARSGPRLGIDRARHRLEYFGGRDAAGTALADAWTLDLTSPVATWQPQGVVGIRLNYGTHAYVMPGMRGPWAPADTVGGAITATDFTGSGAQVWLATFGDSLRCTPLGIGPIGLYADEPFAWTPDGRVVRIFPKGFGGPPADWTQFELDPNLDPMGIGNVPRNLDGSGPWLGRRGSAMIWDPVAHRVLAVQGDRDLGDNNYFADGAVLSFDLSGTPNPWTHADPAAPVPGTIDDAGVHLMLDPKRDRLVQQGAESDTWGGPSSIPLWAMSPHAGGFWTELRDSACAPHWAVATTLDPVRDAIVSSGTGPSGAGVNLFSLASPQCSGGELAVTGSGPNHTPGPLVYDSLRDRYWAFGAGASQTEAWSFDAVGLTWRREALADDASVLNSTSGVFYDAAADRFLCTQDDGANPAHVAIRGWAPGQTGGWTVLSQSPPIPGGSQPFWAALDDRRHRLVVGQFADSSPSTHLTTYAAALDGSGTWQALDLPGPGPYAAGRTHAVYDAAEDCVILGAGNPHGGSYWRLDFGGAATPILATADDCALDGAGAVHVTWSVSADRSPWSIDRSADGGAAWEQLATRSASAAGQIAFVDPSPPRGVRVGYRLSRASAAGTTATGDTWIAVPGGSALGVPDLALAGMQPARGALSWTVRLAPGAARGWLRVFDATGRVAFARQVTGGGAQSVTVAEGTLGSGVFFARLTQGAAQRTVRFVHFR